MHFRKELERRILDMAEATPRQRDNMTVGESMKAVLTPAPALPEKDVAEYTLWSIPPSTNHLFLNVEKYRVKTEEYKSWIELAGAELKAYGLVRVPSTVNLTITLIGKFNEGRDLANFEKATVDLLVSLGIIAGDNLKHVVDQHWRYRPSDETPCVHLRIERVL